MADKHIEATVLEVTHRKDSTMWDTWTTWTVRTDVGTFKTRDKSLGDRLVLRTPAEDLTNKMCVVVAGEDKELRSIRIVKLARVAVPVDEAEGRRWVTLKIDRDALGTKSWETKAIADAMRRSGVTTPWSGDGPVIVLERLPEFPFGCSTRSGMDAADTELLAMARIGHWGCAHKEFRGWEKQRDGAERLGVQELWMLGVHAHDKPGGEWYAAVQQRTDGLVTLDVVSDARQLCDGEQQDSVESAQRWAEHLIWEALAAGRDIPSDKELTR